MTTTGIHPFENVRRFMTAGHQDVTGESNETAELYLTLIEEEMGEFWNGVYAKNDQEILDGICDSIWVLAGYAHARGWNLIGAFNEVARSNLSKVDKASGMILKNESGKIIKPETYSPPELTPFLRRICDQPNPEFMVMGLGEDQ